ncbi:MAG: peptidylprolyl isomerase [Pseudomonadota bacterium]
MSTFAFTTPFGDIEIELDVVRAPETAGYFKAFIERGGLDDGAIFRVTSETDEQASIEDQPRIRILQVGTSNGLQAPRHKIPHESTSLTGIQHRQWSISAARFAPGEVYGSFFVCLRDEPSLDHGGSRQPDGHGYAAFGQVTRGRQSLLQAYTAARKQDAELLSTPIAFHFVTDDRQ